MSSFQINTVKSKLKEGLKKGKDLAKKGLKKGKDAVKNYYEDQQLHAMTDKTIYNFQKTYFYQNINKGVTPENKILMNWISTSIQEYHSLGFGKVTNSLNTVDENNNITSISFDLIMNGVYGQNTKTFYFALSETKLNITKEEEDRLFGRLSKEEEDRLFGRQTISKEEENRAWQETQKQNQEIYGQPTTILSVKATITFFIIYHNNPKERAIEFRMTIDFITPINRENNVAIINRIKDKNRGIIPQLKQVFNQFKESEITIKTTITPQKQRFCRECGAELEQDASFCHNCGSKLAIILKTLDIIKDTDLRIKIKKRMTDFFKNKV